MKRRPALVASDRPTTKHQQPDGIIITASTLRAKEVRLPATSKQPQTVDEYIAALPSDARSALEQVRAAVRKAAPLAEERMSYRMPTFFQNGVVVHIGAFKQHIGLFPPVRGDATLEKALVKYVGEKGNLRFPLDEPMPLALITRIVKHRVKQNAARKTRR